MELNAETDFNM